MNENPYSAIDLSLLSEAIAAAEAEHRQDIPLRTNADHAPAGCACGLRYEHDTAWSDSKRHLREVTARAVVGALHRPCDSCLGSGIWSHLRRDYECPECGGRGRTLTPLPAMMFQDIKGHLWSVESFKSQDESHALARVSRDL